MLAVKFEDIGDINRNTAVKLHIIKEISEIIQSMKKLK